MTTQRGVPWQAKFLALAVIWGSVFLFMMVGLRAREPVQISTLRVLSGGLVLLALRGHRHPAPPANGRRGGHPHGVRLPAVHLPFTLFAYGGPGRSAGRHRQCGHPDRDTPRGHGLPPSDRPTRRKVTGVLLGLLGVSSSSSPGATSAAPTSSASAQRCWPGRHTGWGGSTTDAPSADATSAGWLSRRRSSVAAGGQLVVVLAGWWLVNRSSVALPWSVRPGSAPLWPVLAVLALGVLGTGVAFAFQFDVVRAAGPTVGATVTYLIPIVAVLLGVLVLGERLSWPQLVGAGIVIGSAALTQRPSRR